MATGQACHRARGNGSRPRLLIAGAMMSLAAIAGAAAALPPNYVAAGKDGARSFAIAADSVRRHGTTTSYDLMASTAGRPVSEASHLLVDCTSGLRAFVPDAKVGVATRLPAVRVRPGSREAAELATACELPAGPPARLFAGFIVSADGVLVAPHLRTQRCGRVVAWVGGHRRVAAVVAQEDDLTLLRIDGGPYRSMPAAPIEATGPRVPVTMLGRDGLSPRISAAIAMPAGSDRDDPGWPQVVTLGHLAVPAGPVWNARGGVVGFGVFVANTQGGHAMVRMIPTETLQQKLRAHAVHWPQGFDAALDAETALRAALAATVPLACEDAP
jgi:hypothetical protein